MNTRINDAELIKITGKWNIPTGGTPLNGYTIANTYGHGRISNPAPLAAHVVQLDTYRRYDHSNGHCTDYLFCYDITEQRIFSVDTGWYNSEAANISEHHASVYEQCDWANEQQWREVTAIVLDAERRTGERNKLINDYMKYLRLKVGQKVVIMRGKKMAKGTVAVVERIIDGPYGLAVSLNGTLIAVKNIAPMVGEPKNDFLRYYYDRREDFMLR